MTTPPPGWSPPQPGWVPAPARFWTIEFFLGGPVFLVVGPLVVVGVISHPSTNPVEIFFGVVFGLATLAVIWQAIAGNVVATIYPDGVLTFRSLTGITSTHVTRVREIRRRAAGVRGYTTIFYFEGGHAVLMGLAGSGLARRLVRLNPAIVPPRGATWSRWR